MEERTRIILIWLAFYAVVIGAGLLCWWILAEFPVQRAPMPANMSFFNNTVLV